MLRPTIGAALAALALLPSAALADAAPAAPAGDSAPPASSAPTPTPAPTPKPKPYNYAVIGDIPYGAAAISAFPTHIQQINNDPSIHLVMHVGDIKNGSSRCDTSYFDLIRTDFDGFKDPFIYTPGDNEWTDCHRTNNGGYQPAGPEIPGSPIITPGPSRLDEVRRIFFPTPGTTLGQRTRHVAAQTPAFPENQRWLERERKVTAAMFNVPGSNNDLLPWFGAAETPALAAAQAKEYAKRNAADLRWLDKTFQEATDQNSKAVLLGIQADMWDPAITGDPTQYSGFKDFVQKLASLSKSFGKPVLLINGDSHLYEADTPLGDHTATNSTIYDVKFDVPNLKRITVDGSNNANDYLRLSIDPSTPDVFSWERVPYTP